MMDDIFAVFSYGLDIPDYMELLGRIMLFGLFFNVVSDIFINIRWWR